MTIAAGARRAKLVEPPNPPPGDAVGPRTLRQPSFTSRRALYFALGLPEALFPGSAGLYKCLQASHLGLIATQREAGNPPGNIEYPQDVLFRLASGAVMSTGIQRRPQNATKSGCDGSSWREARD
jgi:hypothetical protein